MKRTILILSLALSLGVSLRAQVYLFDDFNYSDGNIVTNSSGAWTNHSGTSGDSLVQGGRYQIQETRFDDVNRQLSGYSGGMAYVSFILNASAAPSTAAGNYIAHFKDNTVSNFYARIFTLGTGSLPGTYRLGVAGATNVANKTFALDLATNLEYQVVLSWDPVNLYATMWVNPAAETDPSIFTVDAVTGYQPITSYAFRQSTGEGVLAVDDLLVGASFTSVVTNAPRAPVIGTQPQDVIAYSGSNARLLVLASGTGPLSYQWLRGTTDLGVNTNVLDLSSVSGANAGDYTVVISGAGGSVTSQVAKVTVNTTPTTPFFTLQPKNQTNTVGGSVTLSALADGTGPISYQWTFFGTNLSGQTTPTLTLTNLSFTQTGPYYVIATGGAGSANSATSYVAVAGAVFTNIAYLRTLQDTNTWLPTNTTALWQAEGVVTTHTNLTTAGNSSFYIHDGTAGIDVFFGGWSGTNTPPAGARVRVIGPLGVFSSLLEFNLTTSNPNHSVTVLSSNNPMPLSISFNDFSLTNNLPAIEALEGSLVTITNLHFPTGGGSATFAGGGQNVTITNDAGQQLILRVDARVGDIVGKPMPRFAYEVTGVLGQFQGNTTQPRSNGYQIIPTRYSDIVTNLPAVFNLAGSRSGNGLQINWPAAAGSTYSLWSADSVSGPWTRLVFGLNFLGSAGGTGVTNTTAAVKHFRVSTP
jgi:hypothetical protein